MASYKIYARPRDRRSSLDTPVYRLYQDEDAVSHTSRRSSRFDERDSYDEDRNVNSRQLILAEPARRSREETRLGRSDRDRALVMYPTQRRSKSQTRFREEASVIEDEPTAISTDGKTYVRSTTRPGQRPRHALVRNKSRRRRASSEDEHDLEHKTSRNNRQFREKRDDLEVEEATVLVRAKSRGRDRRGSSDEDDYKSRRDDYYSRSDWDSVRERNRKPRIEIPSDDDRDIMVVPSNRRRRNTVDDTSSRYSEQTERPRYPRSRAADSEYTERADYPKSRAADQKRRPAASTRARSPAKSTRTRSPEKNAGDYIKKGGNYVRQGEGFVRSGEQYFRQGRELVEGMRGLMT